LSSFLSKHSLVRKGPKISCTPPQIAKIIHLVVSMRECVSFLPDCLQIYKT